MNELNKKLLKFAGFKRCQDTMALSMPSDEWWYPNISHPLREHALPPDFPNDLNACFEHLVPLVGFDTLWIIRNPDKTSYCWGYTRGIDNDVICWSKTLPIEDCLSPIEDEPATAFCKAVELLERK